MKRLISICVAVVLLFSAIPAMAKSGNELKRQIAEAFTGGSTADSLASLAAANGYVEAVIDSLPYGICLPSDKGIPASQILAIVQKYLNEHPENLHWRASILVGTALSAVWPCKK